MDVIECTLLVLACAAAAADLRTGQIPNRLIATGLCCALLGNLLQSGCEGVFSSLLGGAVPLLTLYLLFAFHMIGAGDIKFLIMAGAFTGPVRIFTILIDTFLIGGVFSVLLLIKRGNIHSRFLYFAQYINEWLEKGRPGSYLEGVTQDGRFCFSVPILLGILAEWVF